MKVKPTTCVFLIIFKITPICCASSIQLLLTLKKSGKFYCLDKFRQISEIMRIKVFKRKINYGSMSFFVYFL